MDDKGRVLYSYADGCIDNCVNGPPNSYTSRATIARQSGGKGLLAAKDANPTEPILPQAACLSGRRDDLGSYLRWVAPDNGGSDITLYKIFRGTTPDNLVQIGQQVGNKTTYTDRSVDNSVAIYTYKIVAVNSVQPQGDGPPSNIIQLPIGPRPPTTGACTAPGIQLLVDPLGDPTDTNAQHDITSISVAEPLDDPVTGAASKIYFTIKVADLSAPIAPGWRWSVRFNVTGFSPPAHPVLGAQEDWHVSMVTSDGAAPTFTYGTTGVFQGASRFFVTLGNLDASSTAQPDGTITLVLPKSVFPGIEPGDAINVTLGSVRATVPSAIPGTGGTNETIPDVTGAGAYTLRAANLCLPNTEPLAVLASNINTGVKPLTVNFDGSASSDPDAIDTIATYTFNFGESDDDVVQSTPTISHTFNNAGLYDVKLVVTDSRGKLSSNTAHQLIEVLQPFGMASVVSRKMHGTAGSFDIDLPLTGNAGVECRAGGANNAYQLVYRFNRNIAVAGTATASQPTAGVSTAPGPGPDQVSVNLTGVTNVQHLVVTLNGVQDAAGAVLNNLGGRMDLLIGDVNASRIVTSGDTNLCKAQALQPVTSANFRNDINASGAVTTGDVNIIKQNALSQLPAAP
jgi:PKD repeat protein